MSKDFDSFIKELVEERICEMPRPPKEEVWRQLMTQLRQEQRKERKIKRLKQLRPVFTVCMVIIFLIVLYINPNTHVAALTNKIIKSIIVMTEDTFKIYKKVDFTASDNVDYLFGRDIEDPRIGEAQKKVHFRLFVPEYIPKDFNLDSVDVLNKNEKKETVTFLYINSNSDKKDCFEIRQRSYSDDASVTMNIKKDENTKIENLTIDGIAYTSVSYEKNLNGLLWDNGNIGCEISGNISRNDIIEIAKSMK